MYKYKGIKSSMYGNNGRNKIEIYLISNLFYFDR